MRSHPALGVDNAKKIPIVQTEINFLSIRHGEVMKSLENSNINQYLKIISAFAKIGLGKWYFFGIIDPEGGPGYSGAATVEVWQ